MIDELRANIVQTFRAPRSAARRAIETYDSVERIGLIFGLSFCISAIFLLLRVTLLGEDAGQGGVLAFIVSNLIASAVAFTIMVAMIVFVGRMFGGQGSVMEVAAALAWHSLVTAFFTPFVNPLAFMAEEPGNGIFLSLVFMAITLWLLVNFIAEAHRFSSAWRVAGVMIGMLFLISALVPILFGGSISAP